MELLTLSMAYNYETLFRNRQCDHLIQFTDMHRLNQLTAKLSAIFSVQNYLPFCLHSIFAQTYLSCID